MTESDDSRRMFQVTIKKKKRLMLLVSSWNKSSASIEKMHELQKLAIYRTGLGFGNNNVVFLNRVLNRVWTKESSRL